MTTRKRSVLLVDDDAQQVAIVSRFLERSGQFTTQGFTDPEEALDFALSSAPDAVICDLVMPGMDGFELTAALREAYPVLPILMVTASAEREDAERSYRAGATDFVTKPVQAGSLVARLNRALDEEPARDFLLRSEQRGAGHGLIGSHPRMAAVRTFVEQVALVPRAPVFILGESGTGKSLVARAIHSAGQNSIFRFVEVNCAALPGNLLESELFGYEKGAFTDARQRKRGLAEIADQGTLFLDEIGTLPLDLQAKLLTFIESRTFRRVGGTEDVPVDIRIVAATNVDIEAEVREGRFREDLYYRLNVAHVVLPPLRDIRSDIPELAAHFARQAAEAFNKPLPALSDEVRSRLQEYDWPGNARELRNVIERALIFSSGEDLAPTSLPSRTRGSAVGDEGGFFLPRGLTLDEVERRMIEEALADAGGHLSDAARALGVTRKVLWARRRKHGLA